MAMPHMPPAAMITGRVLIEYAGKIAVRDAASEVGLRAAVSRSLGHSSLRPIITRIGLHRPPPGRSEQRDILGDFSFLLGFQIDQLQIVLAIVAGLNVTAL
jgi:hypothetical protein